MPQEYCFPLARGWEVAALPPYDGAEPPALDGLDWIPASVPGAVQYDLMAAGRLENPLASREAAAKAAWVPQGDWLYRCRFTCEAPPAGLPQAALEFESIDTFAQVWLNGALVGRAGNMFRPYAFPLGQGPLRPGENTLLVQVKAHRRIVSQQYPDVERIAVSSNPTAHQERALIRRYQRSYNTSLLNLGENVIGIGIPGPVRLCFYPLAYITDAYAITEALHEDGRATVRLGLEVQGAKGKPAPLTCSVALYEAGREEPAAEMCLPVARERLEATLTLPQARLWWPAGYGEPHLYRLRATLSSREGVIHTLERRIGIKTVELVTSLPNGRPIFQFRVNGQEVYARGGNLMPLDAIKGRGTSEAYRRIVRLALLAHMNMIRLWGGGVPEDEEFLDLCDEAGVMVWQDFLYHSGTYPDDDPLFMAEAEAEARDLIRKMRRHACLSLLCGGNEQQQGWDEWNWKAEMDRFYGERLIHNLLPRVCQEEAPHIPYIPNSPHGGIGGQSPTVGDTHTWGNYYNATKDPLFVTETCWIYDSYSRPETLRESMALDVEAFASKGWHHRWKERTGLSLFTKFPFTHYYDVSSLRGYLRALEIEQLEADYQALAYLRFRSPSCKGILYWPLNKGGPLFGFGCIDYGQRPLMAYYALRRLFADAAIHLYRDIEALRVVGANAGARPLQGTLRLWHLDAQGQVRRYWEIPATLERGESVRLFDVADFYPRVIDRTREFAYAQFVVEGKVLAEDRLLFCPLAEFREEKAGLQAALEPAGPSAWRLTLKASAPTMLVEIESDRRLLYGDNDFTLTLLAPKEVWISALEGEPSGGQLTISTLDGERLSLALEE